MAYDNTPEATREILAGAGFDAETVSAIEAALGGRFGNISDQQGAIGGEGGSTGAITPVTATSYEDPEGDEPVIIFQGESASFTATAGETVDRFIVGTAGNDTIQTADGADVVRVGRGDDTIDTGGGIDAVRVDGALASAQISVAEDGTVTVATGAGTKTLRNTEIVTFEDKKVVIAENTEDASIALLYEAAFGRQIDNAGYRFWEKATEGANEGGAGLTVEAVAETFASSDEFVDKFGALSNQDFVNQIYTNFFDRSADAEGRQFWLDLLESGEISRGEFLKNVAGSEEAFTKFADVVKVVGAATSTDSTDDSGAIG